MNESYERFAAIGGRLIISLLSASIIAWLSTRFTPVWGSLFWIIFIAGVVVCFLCLCLFGAQPKSESEPEWRG